MIRSVECFYVDKPHGVGASASWIIVGVDSESYLVKFNVYPDKTAFNELLCNNIASFFGLPILEPVLIELTQDHCDVINKERTKNNLDLINKGIHFGVKLVQPFYTVGRFSQTFGFPLTKNLISNLHIVPDIFGFDTLVQNVDRHCDNVCILNTPKTKNMFSYCIFDHSHAFGGPRWFAQIIKERYDNLQPIPKFCFITDNIERLVQFDRFFRVLDELKINLDSIFTSIPKEWVKNIQSDVAQLKSCILNISKDKLGDMIKTSNYLFKGGKK